MTLFPQMKYIPYWPKEGAKVYGNFKVDLVKVKKTDNLIIRTLDIKFKVSIQKLLTLSLLHIP